MQLGAGEVAVAVIDCLELAAVDRDHGFDEELQFAAQHDELAADATDALRIVLTEVGDGTEVGHQTPDEPHQLQVALRSAPSAVDQQQQFGRRPSPLP